MSRAISLVLFVVIIMVSGSISAAKANGTAICYFHGVDHPAPPVFGGEIWLDYAEPHNITGKLKTLSKPWNAEVR